MRLFRGGVRGYQGGWEMKKLYLPGMAILVLLKTEQVWYVWLTVISFNRPFSKMAAENSKKLKLAKIKNVYQH